MDPKAPIDETRRKKEILDKNGLVVIALSRALLLQGSNRKLFEFCKFMGNEAHN